MLYHSGKTGEVIFMYKILVADDEKDVVSLLKDPFEINDYPAITAYSSA